MKDYYEILGVHKKASKDIITKVFRIQIKKNHPDLFSGDEKKYAETKTQELNEAYDTLSDDEKREEYDEMYEEENTTNNNAFDLLKENEYLRNVVNEQKETIDKLLSNNPYAARLEYDNHINNSQEEVMFDKYYTQEYNNFHNNSTNQTHHRESYAGYILRIFRNFFASIISLLFFIFLIMAFLKLFAGIDLFKF